MTPINVKLQPVVISDKPHEPYIARDDALSAIANVLTNGDNSKIDMDSPNFDKKLVNQLYDISSKLVGPQTPLSPEALAVTCGKYSRSKAGFGELKSKIKFGSQEIYRSSLDSVLKHTDYGHASIMGLTSGIPVAVDGLSMITAYLIHNVMVQEDSQEGSTRYITMDVSGLPSPESIGLVSNEHAQWIDLMGRGFERYHKNAKKLDERVREKPDLVFSRMTPAEIEQIKPAAKERMITNYALDRARYFIPFATQTNAVYVATARVWNEAVKTLASMPQKEVQYIAGLIRDEVAKAAPRFVRHGMPDERSIALQKEYWSQRARDTAQADYAHEGLEDVFKQEIFIPSDASGFGNPAFIENRPNRYAYLGGPYRDVMVSSWWNNVAVAEARDLNRHRTGVREFGFIPSGLYLPKEIERTSEINSWNRERVDAMKRIAATGDASYAYHMVLGDQSTWFHRAFLDKQIYKDELRTGLGAHFRYAEHLRPEAYGIIEKFPELRENVVIGDARPEPV